MESALIISQRPWKRGKAGSAGEPGPSAANRLPARAVLPEAVAPKMTGTGKGDLLFFDLVLNLVGKDLFCGQGNYLAVVFLDRGITDHRKLVRAADGSAGYLVYIARKFDEVFKWKYHSLNIQINSVLYKRQLPVRPEFATLEGMLYGGSMDTRSGNQNTQMPGWLSPSIVLLVVAIVFALMLGSTSFFIVDQTEDSVITRFGKYTTTVGPGLHFKLPLGIDKSYNVPTKSIQTEQFGFRTLKGGVVNSYENNLTKESTMLTGDLNIVDVEWIIQYRIMDSKAWLFNVHQDVRNSTIRDISQSVINSLVGDRAILDVIGPERTAIENNAISMMNDQLKEFGLGVTIINVQLQNIVPPAGVQAAFEDVNKAIQDMNRLINEGKEAYNAEIPKASGEAEKLLQVAQGYAAERVNRAQGDVARFNSVYAEYRKAPEVTRRRLYLETIESLFKEEKGTTLVDKKLENFLPLKNMTTGGN